MVYLSVCITALLLTAAWLPQDAQAASITFHVDSSNPSYTRAISNYRVEGNDMVGMKVTYTFTDGTSSHALWQSTGSHSGGALGTGWSLTESYDTYDQEWEIDWTNSDKRLFSILLKGDPSTVFDRRNPSPGTEGSSSGRDFAAVDDFGNYGSWFAVDVYYLNPVALMGQTPIGDLYRNMLIQFTGGTHQVVTGYEEVQHCQQKYGGHRDYPGGPWHYGYYQDCHTDYNPIYGDETVSGLAWDTNYSFLQDTDNAAGAPVPEPGSMILLGSGLIGLAGAVRRRMRR